MSAVKNKRSLGAQPLISPQPSLLICSYDAAGKPNVMAAAWAGICYEKAHSELITLK